MSDIVLVLFDNPYLPESLCIVNVVSDGKHTEVRVRDCSETARVMRVGL